jgi:hypothetical protein
MITEDKTYELLDIVVCNLMKESFLQFSMRENTERIEEPRFRINGYTLKK